MWFVSVYVVNNALRVYVLDQAGEYLSIIQGFDENDSGLQERMLRVEQSRIGEKGLATRALKVLSEALPIVIETEHDEELDVYTVAFEKINLYRDLKRSRR